MKIRNGFVSNSSSSSFIIGIANLKDKVLPGSFEFDPQNKTPWEIETKALEDGSYDLSIESFMHSTVHCTANVGDNILYMYETPGDDSDFYDEDSWEYDYDIDLDFFSLEEVTKYKLIQKFGGEAHYGAGRDG